MAAKVALTGRKRRVFESVFTSTMSTISQSIPQSTASNQDSGQDPQASFSTQGSFHDLIEDPVGQQAAWDSAWLAVTAFLSIKKTTKIPLQHMFLDRINNDEEFKAKIFPAPDAGFETALAVVLEPGKHLPLAGSTEDIVVWYTQETRGHFLRVILPHLLKVSNGEFADHAHGHLEEEIVTQSLKTLEGAHRLYINGLSFIVRALESIKPDENSKPTIQKYGRDLHAVVSNSVSKRLLVALKATLFSKMCVAVGMPERAPNSPWPEWQNALPRPSKALRQRARQDLLSLVESLHNVGLGGERFQIVFAELMNECMTDFVQRAFSGAWSHDLVFRVLRGLSELSVKGDLEGAQSLSLLSKETLRTGETTSLSPPTESVQNQIRRSLDITVLPRMVNPSSTSQCITELCDWIENVYARLAVEVFGLQGNVSVSWTDVEKWKEMCIGRLAELRTNELFDIVCNWPESLPALVDLRTAVTTPQQRLKLTNAFSAALEERLLHPGSSTLQILRTYISMIWSFHALDHSKVLLDRVAYPLQLYLFSRDDTVRIIITGLLSDTEDANGNRIQPGGDKLVELALIMNDGSENMGQKVSDEELDWHDMDWVPDPVDAGPGYKRSKSADIIGTLIGVLGPQEVFIKEFQTIMGEILLKHEGNFEKEIKVLELLKSRFGESPLQSCEVMIKDIQDSRTVDSDIRRKQDLIPRIEEVDAMEDDVRLASAEGLHAKILSRLFWPQLHDETFRVPTQIAALQERYSAGFESLKISRKLTWLQALGQVNVELDLEDRVINEEVFTWQATIIWAFEGDPINGDPVSRTVPALIESLEMDEALVRSALTFWVSKLVLYEVRQDEYAVLETLKAEDLERSNNNTGAGAAMLEDLTGSGDTGHSSQQSMQEKLRPLWPMIQGMLTNSMSQMPLMQIAMMLRMVVDGYSYSNEELQEFLQVLVGEGKLEVGAGGRYKLVKK